MYRRYSTDFAIASLDAQGIVRRSDWMVVYCTHPVTREYLCATQEYLCVGATLPPHSFADKPVLAGQRLGIGAQLRWPLLANGGRFTR
ncbi:MAG: hypothetical protein ACMX3H_07490 [Sodalis sp. (in: enterobacteria)]|uniref:hypothetical protein n=1 Tax=Sodalis sp. (in: enterobacteria) TaxID=1898979 RepID=UPI0039E5241A